MQDFPSFSRTPGVTGVLDMEAFEPGEVGGMRSAAWILIATGVLGVLMWAAAPSGPPVVGLVELFLGVQLLRLRHTWRAWAMLRAWIGLAIAAVVCASAFAGSGAAAAAVALSGLGQATYAGIASTMLLFGVPTMKRVNAGRIVFCLSIVFTIAAAVSMTVAELPQPA